MGNFVRTKCLTENFVRCTKSFHSHFFSSRRKENGKFSFLLVSRSLRVPFLLTLITFLFNSIGFSSVELYFLVFANFSDRIWVTVLNWKLAILFHLRIEIHDAGWNAIRLSSGVGPWHLIRSQILEKLHPRNWKRNGNKAREWNFSVKVFSRL